VLSEYDRAYATVYFRSIRNRDEHFQALAKNGLRAEIYFEYGWDRLTLAQHRNLSEIIYGELPGCAIHLPFHAFDPGKADIDGNQSNELLRCLEAAALYEPDHLIGHVAFDSRYHSVSHPGDHTTFKNDSLDGPLHVPSPAFLSHSATFWLTVLDASPAYLYLENTKEHSPLAILSVISLLTPRAAMCLDLGHWFHYAMGRHWDNLETWLEMAGERITHLHLHDNDGSGDQHLGLGQGALDLPKIWSLLAEYIAPPSFTLENHNLNGLLKSLTYFKENPLY
jgi:hypothetical protein